MATPPDGRVPTDGATCFSCLSPIGTQPFISGWIVWVKAYAAPGRDGGWMALPAPTPPPPNPHNRTTPGVSPDGTLANSIKFSSGSLSSGAGTTPPQLAVTGAPGSTGDPATDGNRKAVGRTSTGIVFGN